MKKLVLLMLMGALAFPSLGMADSPSFQIDVPEVASFAGGYIVRSELNSLFSKSDKDQARASSVVYSIMILGAGLFWYGMEHKNQDVNSEAHDFAFGCLGSFTNLVIHF